jgi:hypothetical protein
MATLDDKVAIVTGASKGIGAANRGGSIVNISSVVSLSPRPNLSVYSATKAAVDAITQSLASELGPKKILVNSILPGATETEGFAAMAGSAEMKPYAITQTPLRRIGAPRDIANVVAFLGIRRGCLDHGPDDSGVGRLSVMNQLRNFSRSGCERTVTAVVWPKFEPKERYSVESNIIAFARTRDRPPVSSGGAADRGRKGPRLRVVHPGG